MSGVHVKCECGRAFTVHVFAEVSRRERQLRDAALELVADRPGELSRTQLAGLLGCRKRTGLRVVERLVVEGELGPADPRAHLHRTASEVSRG